ncbi:hypothetical protein TGRUB_225120 [Toxoplasma gondii RUB]|uniref:Uncharacterized protein n=3 Tax=Toxoplasma gondii TaxID=5811 RepID=A0A086LVV2_TOXGO|nr:hypothetical protein TGP89_225120 [Toxoplasma gondii p89]KFG60770.1 hypothetical protein TGRUB_225120 [Toxoplasma gondii RUB]KFH13347.1 hypothetical protein TGVAND_225120 [Toxoplasma gondii VAND]
MASRSALDDDLSEEDFLQRRPRRRTWGRTFSVSKTRTGPWGKALKVGTVAILGAAALGIAAKLGHSAAQIYRRQQSVTPGGVIGTGPYGNRPPGQAGSPPPSFRSQAEADAAFFSDPLIRETMDSQLPSSSQRRANEEAYEGNFVSASSAAPAWWLPEDQQNEPIPVVPLPDFSWMLRYVPQRVFDAVNTVNRWIDARERIPVRQDRESGERNQNVGERGLNWSSSLYNVICPPLKFSPVTW